LGVQVPRSALSKLYAVTFYEEAIGEIASSLLFLKSVNK
jgi:hypothetical protein